MREQLNDEARDESLCLGVLSELFKKCFHWEKTVEVQWP